jgi:hypothetical protein
METLRENGLRLINENFDRLVTFAKALQSDSTIEDDHWTSFDVKTGLEATVATNTRDAIDLNIWREDADTPWSAQAYPLEELEDGQVQVSTREYVELY